MSERPPSAWPAEVSLGVLTAVTAITFWRLFIGTAFVLPLVGAAVAAHVLCWWMRRVGLSLVLALPLWAVGAALYVTESWYRRSTRFGLPTRATWHLAQDDLTLMARSFGTAVAPVPSSVGYLVAAALGLWLVAFAADTLAFRALGGVEAVLPAGVGFVMASALGDGHRMLVATGLWVGSAMFAVAMLRALRARSTGVWLTTRQDTAVATAARWTAAVGVVALVAGLVVGPRLPGSEAQALVNTHSGSEDTSRVTVSPLVDIKSRLSSRSSTVAFRVRTDHPSYLRLSALDTFDGQRWTPSFDYEPLPTTLDGPLIPGVTSPVTQTITIDKLGRVFVPAAYSPTSVRSTRSLQWDDELKTLVVNRGELKAGDSFTIVSAVPDKDKLTATLLESAIAPVPNDVAGRYLGLPAATRRRVQPDAQAIVQAAGARTTYDEALALQNWFRDNFTYDLNVPSGSGTSAIDAFLNAKRGYCEQFAGTMAAMARSLGIPSRVAVGFTQGVLQADGSYLVEGKHAHAWPELYLGGVGWVPFEPTPGRGNPDAAQYTGVPTQQVDQPASAATAATTTVAVDPAAPTTAADPNLRPEITFPEVSIAPFGQGGSNGPRWWLALAIGMGVAAALVAGWIVAVRMLYRRRWARRLGGAPTPAHRVVVTWHHTLDQLRRAGYRYRPQDTPAEVAGRLGTADNLRDIGLERMARHVTVAAYAGSQPEAGVVTEVDEIARVVGERVSRVGTRRQRLLRRLDPRQLWDPLPGEDQRHDADD